MRPIAINDLIKAPKFVKKPKQRPRVPAKVVKPSVASFSAGPSALSHKLSNELIDVARDSDSFVPLVNTREPDPLETPQDWRAKSLDDMTKRDWRAFNEEYDIKLKNNPVRSLRWWHESLLNAKILSIVDELGYTDPTPIQRAAIPVASSFRDVIAIAETGSGKTLAYILPMLQYISDRAPKIESQAPNQPFGLILAPTRELANQISAEAAKFAAKLGLHCITIIGGHDYDETKASIAHGVHLVVATPGRLVDTVNRKLIDLSHCHYIVFDEADRMIDMGFEADLHTIYQWLPSRETSRDAIITGMYSATFSPGLDKLALGYLHDPVKLVIGKVGEKVNNIVQRFQLVEDNDDEKMATLLEIIKPYTSIIIFANYIKVVEYLGEVLAAHQWPNYTLHGQKSQRAREKAMDEFSKRKVRVLIATDVAARGIDIADVELVVNYQMTTKLDEYIHRIGRTGRGGVKGNSFTFLTEADNGIFGDLSRFLNHTGPTWLRPADFKVLKE